MTSRDVFRANLLAELAERIGHEFRRPELLAEALVHPSMGNERKDSYERLEFLGDAVLGLFVAEYFFAALPDRAEGELTRMRSAIVSQAPLAAVARRLELPKCVLAGRGMTAADLDSERILANLLEAVLAAVYLDGGVRAARRFVKQHVLAGVGKRATVPETPRDPKSRLLHAAQAEGLGQPAYRVLESQGPDHARTFLVAVELGDVELARGSGSSKRAAQHAAAELAIEALRRRGGSPAGA